MDKETALKIGLAAFVIFIVFFVHCDRPKTRRELYDEYYGDRDEEGYAEGYAEGYEEHDE